MRQTYWIILAVAELGVAGLLLSAPNSFYNQPSTVAQYAGYTRGVIPLLPLGTAVLFSLDYKKAKTKKTQLRAYCPSFLTQAYDSIPVSKFLRISQNQISQAISEQILLEHQNHAVTTFFKELT
jgi:hypothetical protein